VSAGPLSIASAGYPDADLPILKTVPNDAEVVDGRGNIFRYAIRPFLLNGAQAFLADGVDARGIRESVGRLRTSLLLVIPVLLAGSISVGYWLAGRALAPLVVIADALSEIRPNDLSQRLSLAPVEDELNRLIRAINALLERLERASSAERRFAADAAHELRTPLAVLRTAIEVTLRHERSAEEYGRALNSALRDAAAVSAMADDLLALTCLDQELSLGNETIELGALVKEVTEALEPLISSKQLTIGANLGAANVQGNREHLRRVIVNLLDNALRFTPAGGRIAVALQSEIGRVTLRVADAGPGIDDDDLPFIFDRFFRGRNGRSEPGKGLGLSLCREIVKLHGGELSARNRSGGGTEFLLTLPSSPSATLA